MFVIRKWIGIYDLSGVQYSPNKNIRFKTPTLTLDLCEYSDAYIVAKGETNLLAAAENENDKVEQDVAFKNNAPLG